MALERVEALELLGMTLAHLNIAEASGQMSSWVPLLMAVRDKLAAALLEGNMSYTDAEARAAHAAMQKYRGSNEGEVGAALIVVGLSAERAAKETQIRDDMMRVAYRVACLGCETARRSRRART